MRLRTNRRKQITLWKSHVLEGVHDVFRGEAKGQACGVRHRYLGPARESFERTSTSLES